MRAIFALLLCTLVLHVALPSTPAHAGSSTVFVADPSAGTLPQDQLAEKLATAAKQGGAVRLPAGRFRVQRTLWLPPKSALVLEPGATIVGSIPGQSLVRLQSGSRLSGGTVENQSDSDAFDVDVAEGSSGSTVDGVTFRGFHVNAVYVNAPDVRNLTIRRNHFVGTVYGVLINPNASRASNLRIDQNDFRKIAGDAIELNAPFTSPTDAVRDVFITRNTVHGMRGSGAFAGFGVGVAGVQNFQVVGNRFFEVRNEAVHLEAKARNGVVRDNLIDGGGHHDRPAIAIYRTVDSVQIQGNAITAFDGGGIGVLWDSIGSSTNISISRNVIRNVTEDGVVVGGNRGTGPFTVSSNAIAGARLGIVLLGDHGQSVASGNLVRRVSGQAVRTGFVGTGTRIVSNNGPMTSRSRGSVVGSGVMALLRVRS